MEVKNATTVHRLWGSLEDAELLAVFQYDNDAEDFCRATIDRQPDNCALIWVSHCSGKMNIVRRAPELAKS